MLRTVSNFITPIVISECSSLLGRCRPESTEDVEHPADHQPTSAGESSHAAEERVEPSRTADQRSPEQQREEPTPTAEEPSVASSGTIGIVVVKESGTGNPASEAPASEAAPAEEKAEIEEIVHPEEEKLAPQCVRVARKQGDEWVFYEEDHSNRAVCKLQRIVEDLMGQIKVRALEPRSCPSSFLLRNYCY
jgi:cytoskeletal protein RodZ